MKGYVANTDFDWYAFLRDAEPPLRDVNFWKPSAEVGFQALEPGEPFFFKLKKPHYAICRAFALRASAGRAVWILRGTRS